jgi:hypothetical protein
MEGIVNIATIIIASLAFITSVIATILAKKSIDAQTESAKNSALVAQTQRNEQALISNPDILELYGITKDDLNKAGISAQELLYILSDLRQGEIFHRIEGFRGPFISEYRKNFLTNPKVKIAFESFIRNHLMSDSPYTQAIDQFLQCLVVKQGIVNNK